MPRQAIRLRGDDPPADATLVIRGGVQSLSDELLERAAETNRAAFGFWAISVFLAPGDDLVALSREVPAIRRRRSVRTAACGVLRSAGFALLDTTRHRCTTASSLQSSRSPRSSGYAAASVIP